MPDIQIEVIYCPHESFKDDAPLASWPRVPGVTVILTKKAGHAGDGPHTFAETDKQGLSGPCQVGEGTYTVKMRVPRLWTLATKDIAVDKAAKPISRTIILIPDEDRQLVLWKLTYDDPVAGSGALEEASIKVAGHEFLSDGDGRVAAVATLGTATAKFEDHANADGTFLPQRKELNFPVSKAKNPAPRTMVYASDIRLSVEPVVKPPYGPESPLEGAVVTLDLNGLTLPAKTLGKKQHKVTFDRLEKGTYGIAVTPPTEGMTLVTSLDAIDLQPGDAPEVRALFRQERKIGGYVETEDGKRVTQPVELLISGDDGHIECEALKGEFEKFVAMDDPLTISVVPSQKLELAGIPLKRPAQDQPVLFPQETIVKLEYEHAIKGQALDEHDMPVPGVMVAIFDAKQGHLTTVQADDQGQFIYGVAKPGDYFVAQQPRDDRAAALTKVEVHSNGLVALRVRNELARDTEAFTDLAAYPVLTEEVSTTGIPAPASGGPGTGGTDYGTVVDQAMRDVLGWRPGADVTGFRAALTGAFQLREVEGHTEWTWQQRGYAVQADMGALTGAQASIYARAKSALDQILPLLAGLTPLNPALFPPQDLEAIRTVINAELQELVSELALPGGPRIQRADQLFELLTGEKPGSKNLNPDVVQGNLGTLRDRFGLTVDEIDTVDEERIVTNFRIVVEQVLSLQASWSRDRGLLAPLDPRASFGTVLIWLSRSLEAVCESVGDLTFALDSVFVDAAQRQVIELNFPGEETLLLSDLLDWVDRASRDEGPRIIQDAGKDGVFAFAPVLRRLRDLIRATRHAARYGHGLPHGMRTPRVDRALQVLVDQLNEATELASSVRRDAPPVIEAARVIASGMGAGAFPAHVPEKHPSVTVHIDGTNFRPKASVVLIAQEREDLPELHARSIKVFPPSQIKTTFRNPATVYDSAGVTWLVAVTNEDGTHSNQFPLDPGKSAS